MTKKTPADALLIGAHTSSSGGPHNALLEAKSIGATTAQLFTSNQKQWKGRELTQEHLALWKEALEETSLQKIMSHDSYLINLGSPDEEILTKSLFAFKEEIKRCHLLEITFLNFHPGASTSGSEEQCLNQIVKSLKSMEQACFQGNTRLLLETTAGQGSSVGHRFEHLAYIIEQAKGHVPLGVCVDTCHIFAAGYDIRTKSVWEKTLQEFDQVIGLKHLFAFHLNDSLKPFGSKRDRHAPLGKGEIGLECFEFLMQDSRLREIPKYLETPDGPPLWINEIQLLREMAEK